MAHQLLEQFQSRVHNGTVVLHIQWCLSLNKGSTQVFSLKLVAPIKTIPQTTIIRFSENAGLTEAKH